MKLTTAKRFVKGYKDSARKNGHFNREHMRKSLREFAAYFVKNPSHEPGS
jgi:hypothetical protein